MRSSLSQFFSQRIHRWTFALQFYRTYRNPNATKMTTPQEFPLEPLPPPGSRPSEYLVVIVFPLSLFVQKPINPIPAC
jgi:hypothetical protein